MSDYQAFLDSKSTACPPAGFDPQQFTAPLFAFQRDIVTMACRVGRFCIWADCGMGKTAMQLECCPLAPESDKILLARRL
jgi:hypothetical protein